MAELIDGSGFGINPLQVLYYLFNWVVCSILNCFYVHEVIYAVYINLISWGLFILALNYSYFYLLYEVIMCRVYVLGIPKFNIN
jgi:hypothetical protein